MLEKDLPKPKLGELKIVQQKKQSQPEYGQIKLSILTQFYPPDFAATGQLIEELAIHLGRLGIDVQVFTGQPGYAFKKGSAPQKERSEKLLIRRSRSARLCYQRITILSAIGITLTQKF